VDIQHLRHSSKVKWLLYYRQNRPWLVRLRIWGTYDGQRRPCSSFILAVLSNLEPQLTEMLPFIVDLSNNPDQVVAALGLNFNPDTELQLVVQAPPVAKTNGNGNGNGLSSFQLVHSATSEDSSSLANPEEQPATKASNLSSWVDESCQGKGEPNVGLVLSALAVIGAVTAVFVGLSR